MRELFLFLTAGCFYRNYQIFFSIHFCTCAEWLMKNLKEILWENSLWAPRYCIQSPISAQPAVACCNGKGAVQDRYPSTREFLSIRCSQCRNNRRLLPANMIAALFTDEKAVAWGLFFYFIAEQAWDTTGRRPWHLLQRHINNNKPLLDVHCLIHAFIVQNWERLLYV